MVNPITITFCFVFLVLLLLHSPLIASQEVEDEREFDYSSGSDKGPENWGDIDEKWHLCKDGGMQSPIDLKDSRVQVVGNLGRVKRSYKYSNATVRNRGHDIMLEWVDDAGSITINGTVYELKQCHWHSPSEHSIDGERYDLELHMVHESSDKKIAVVGIIYKRGRPDTFLSEMMEHIRVVADRHDINRVVGFVNPRHIKIGSRKYYRYMGSLTVPPCTEDVTWTIVKKVRTVSREQVRLLRQAVHDYAEENSRPLQAVNQRAVQLYTPSVDPQP